MAALLLVSGGVLAGCSPVADDDSAGREVLLEDHVGVSFRVAEQLSLEEHYQVAGGRYVELNELFGELQTDISADEWVDNGGRVELVPG